MSVLADAGELQAVYTVLEWMLALSAPEEVQKQLILPEKEANYYRVVTITQLEVVEMLLADDDGLFELRSGRLDARLLWQFMQDLIENAGDMGYSGAR
jgi:hypothetical protein